MTLPDSDRPPGAVYLVGAGPGDPGLITVRGLACLRKADVVIADYLVDARLVAEARPGAEVVYEAWKIGRQERINTLMVEQARQGKTVVRLKGGDPFVFGRGGEEVLYLKQNGIPFTVVPGVTAGVGVPAYAGIPVTHRGYSSTVTFVTGHEDPEKTETAIDWNRLASDPGTLVFFMGARNLPIIAEKLMSHGKPAGTPVALIQWGTTTRQRTLTGVLQDIAPKAEHAGFSRPILILVGSVVELREQLDWYENRPLFGISALVTRTRDQASALSALLEEMGAETIETPLIRIEAPEDREPLDRAVEHLEQYDWLVFTSVNSVDAFFGQLRVSGKDARALACLSIGVVGPATEERLCDFGIIADCRPDVFDVEHLVEAMAARYVLREARILFPGSDMARDTLKDGLSALGAKVFHVAAYRTVQEKTLPPDIMRRFENREIQVVVFASSSVVRAFAQAVGSERLSETLEGVAVACIGPVTRQAALDAGMTVSIMPEQATIPALAGAIRDYFRTDYEHE
jgi:uroporphyrinogen III methyltransferase/synthase